MVPEIVGLGLTPTHRVLLQGPEHGESHVVLGGKHELLFGQVEAKGLAGKGHEPVPRSLCGQALEPCLLPGAGSPLQEGSPCLAVHNQGQLPLGSPLSWEIRLARAPAMGSWARS